MPRNQRFPHARRRRRPRLRFVLAGAALAVGVVLVIPAAAPRGSVLDIQGTGAGQEAIAKAPPPPAPSDPPVATPSPTPSLTAADLALGRVRGAIVGTAPSIASLTGYRWPLAHPRLTLPFGPTPWGSRIVDGKTFHDGVDLATFCGDRIHAAHAGTVIAAGRHYDAVMGWIGDLGPYLRRLDRKQLWSTLPIMVVTDDGNGYRSMYAHFGRIVVRKGQVVKAGQLLGYEGATGRASGCHLHYGLFSPWESRAFAIRPDVAKRMKLPRREIARIDPLKVLPPRAGINASKKSKPTDEPASTSTSKSPAPSAAPSSTPGSHTSP